MNVELLNKVADAIEKEEIAKFDMTVTISKSSHCGTSACVAGFAVLIDGPSELDCLVTDMAQKLLGLSHDEAEHLFYGDRYWNIGFDAIHNREQYVPAALRHMAKTQTINWWTAFEAVGAPPRQQYE